MHLTAYLTMLGAAEEALATSYLLIGDGHRDEPEVLYPCRHFARCSSEHAHAVGEVATRYGHLGQVEPDRLRPPALPEARPGPVGLLRDLQDLFQLATLVETTWTLVGQAAAGARDRPLLDIVTRCHPELTAQLAWLRTRMRAAAAQTLLVAP